MKDIGATINERIVRELLKNDIAEKYSPIEEVKTSGQMGKEEINWSSYFERIEIKKINKLNTLEKVCSRIKRVGICSLDTETTGLDPHKDKILWVQIAIPVYAKNRNRLTSEDGLGPDKLSSLRVYLIPLHENSSKRQGKLNLIVDLLEDKEITVVMHNAAFDLKMLRAAIGRRLATGKLFDTLVGSQLITAGDFVPARQWEDYCLDNEIIEGKEGNKTIYSDSQGNQIHFEKNNQKSYRPIYKTHSLRELTLRHLGIVLNKELQSCDWTQELTIEMKKYAAMDVAVLLPLQEILQEVIVANELEEVAALEFDCVEVTAEIEHNGFYFDMKKALEVQDTINNKLEEIENTLHHIIKDSIGGKDTPVNFNSPKTLLNIIRNFAQEEGVLSKNRDQFVFNNSKGNIVEAIEVNTKDDTLLIVASHLKAGSILKSFIISLKEYRREQKRKSFIDKYIKKLHENTGRLHTSLRQLNPQGVGRFSAFEPSIQQVPNDKDIRELFAAPAGKNLIIADYSTIEMRIMAKLSEDMALSNAFKERIDVHTYTAANILDKDMEEVTSEERKAAKAFNFGLIYGMNADTLKEYAQTSYGVNLSLEEADSMREIFFQLYEGIAEWHRWQWKSTFENNYADYKQHTFIDGYFSERRPMVRTLSNRMRVWPYERKTSQKGNSYIGKVGPITELYNTPCQGTGADILKKAMVLLYRYLTRNNLDEVKVIGTIHDELLIEAPEEQAEKMKKVLEKVMIKAGEYFLEEIPVEVEAIIADDWSSK